MRLGERRAREQIHDVVLPEIHERDTERGGVGPAEHARDAARVAEDVRGRHGRGEVQRRHGGQWIASQHTVQRRPALLPELLAVLDHHPPQLRRAAVLHQALLGRVPRRSGRDHPVADDPDVERRVDPRRGLRELVTVLDQHVRDGPVREREPHPVRPDQELLPELELAPACSSARCSRSVGVVPKPIVLSTLTGYVDPHPALELLRVVVGHLVGGEIGVHLQRAHRRIPRPRARHQRGEGERGRCGSGNHDGRLEAQPAAEQRRREAGGEHRASGRADRGRAGHGRARIYRRAADGPVRAAHPCRLGWPCLRRADRLAASGTRRWGPDHA